MGVQFNAFEIFEIAEKIERNGAAFYRKAAQIFDDPATRNMLLELADWEGKHEQVFANMRKLLSEQSRELRTFELENDMEPVAQAMAGLAVFGSEADPSEELAGKRSKKDILRKALSWEKDSIVYYVGLKNFVPDRAGKDKIDDIIREEMHHIGILNQSLQWR
jgi:rubrerythrin